MTDSDRAKFDEVWQGHQAADWPGDLGGDEGQLMTLDTVIGGCVTYFFEEHCRRYPGSLPGVRHTA